MIDIETYRRKIGGFTSNRHRKEGKKQKKDITPGKFHIRYNIGTMSLRVTILMFTSILLPDDSRSGKNRQRGTNLTNITFTNDDEKQAFLTLRANSKLAKADGHQKFFKNCINEKVYPSNLEIIDHFQVAYKNSTLERTLQVIENSRILQKMHACKTHYLLVIAELNELINQQKLKIQELFSESPYNYIIEKDDQKTYLQATNH